MIFSTSSFCENSKISKIVHSHSVVLWTALTILLLSTDVELFVLPIFWIKMWTHCNSRSFAPILQIQSISCFRFCHAAARQLPSLFMKCCILVRGCQEQASSCNGCNLIYFVAADADTKSTHLLWETGEQGRKNIFLNCPAMGSVVSEWECSSIRR